MLLAAPLRMVHRQMMCTGVYTRWPIVTTRTRSTTMSLQCHCNLTVYQWLRHNYYNHCMFTASLLWAYCRFTQQFTTVSPELATICGKFTRTSNVTEPRRVHIRVNCWLEHSWQLPSAKVVATMIWCGLWSSNLMYFAEGMKISFSVLPQNWKTAKDKKPTRIDTAKGG